jgi:hypothetical protein
MRFLYFDDEIKASQDIAHDLRGSDFVVETSLPPPTLDVSASEGQDGYLVDYDLSMRPAVGAGANYRGGTLASRLREREEPVPIVLITSEARVADKSEVELLEELPAFDAVVFKGDVTSSAATIRHRLTTLSSGFAELRDASRTWSGLVDRLRPPTIADATLLRQIPPPMARGEWEIVTTARWLERTVIRYPGVLLDPLHASALLGVSVATLEDPGASDLLAPAKYLGPFSPEEGRWWRRELEAVGMRLVDDQPRSPLFLTFPTALASRLDREVERSVCVDRCGLPADAVCFILDAHVATEHSLRYNPDDRPRGMMSARVSFKAIVGDNDVRDEHIDPAGGDIVRTLRDRAGRE